MCFYINNKKDFSNSDYLSETVSQRIADYSGRVIIDIRDTFNDLIKLICQITSHLFCCFDSKNQKDGNIEEVPSSDSEIEDETTSESSDIDRESLSPQELREFLIHKARTLSYKNQASVEATLYNACIAFKPNEKKIQEIKDIIHLIPESLNYKEGLHDLAKNCSPLYAACLNEKFPLDLIRLMLEQGANPSPNMRRYLMVGNNLIEILAAIEKILIEPETIARYLQIRELFAEFHPETKQLWKFYNDEFEFLDKGEEELSSALTVNDQGMDFNALPNDLRKTIYQFVFHSNARTSPQKKAQKIFGLLLTSRESFSAGSSIMVALHQDYTRRNNLINKARNCYYSNQLYLESTLYNACVAFRFNEANIQEIKDIIRVIPESLNYDRGFHYCRRHCSPLYAACVNESFPIDLIQFMLEQGANPLKKVYYENNGKLISLIGMLSLIAKGITRFSEIARYAQIRELFEQFYPTETQQLWKIESSSSESEEELSFSSIE